MIACGRKKPCSQIAPSIIASACKTLILASKSCVLVQPDGWARGEREGYGEPCDVTSLSLSLSSAKAKERKKNAGELAS